MREPARLLLVSLLFFCGCTGILGNALNGGDSGGGDGAGPPPQYPLVDLPLPRLSHDEYLATVHDLVTEALPGEADAVLADIMPAAALLPADQLVGQPNDKHGGFARLDQTEQQEYADVPFDVAVKLGAELTSTPARVAALAGPCTNGGTSLDAACLTAFVHHFGELALRRPPSDDDVAFYAGTATASPATPADLANVIAVMLSSPRFLYHVESGGDAIAPDTYGLDAWELASRLSYHFWGTMPDAALRDAARSGALGTDEGYRAQVDRLFASAKTTDTLRTFFHQWLWPLLELPALDSRAGDPVYRAFAGADLPGPALRDHMVGDVLDAASWTLAHGGTLDDLLTNTQSFARDADLAAIYGVPPWDGVSDPPALPPERAGLLTRAAFLSTGTINTRPIMKGVFIRTTILCDNIPPPPPNAANTPIEVSTTETTREVIESITEQPGSACAGCHKPLINPLGFASESFDGLGRARTAQIFYDDTGKVVGEKAVDTTSVPAVLAGDATPSSGIGDVTRLVVESGKAARCLAQRYYRFAFRRIETDADEPVLDTLYAEIKKGSLAEAMKSVALRPEFKQRTVTP